MQLLLKHGGSVYQTCTTTTPSTVIDDCITFGTAEILKIGVCMYVNVVMQ